MSWLFLGNCIWNEWEEWSTCSKSCGGGQRIRKRTIRVPESNGGQCQGESSEREDCNTLPCPGTPILKSKTFTLF